MLTWPKLGHTGPDFADDAGKLVTERDGDGVATYGMRRDWRKSGTAYVLVEVCPANPDESRCDLGCELVVLSSSIAAMCVL